MDFTGMDFSSADPMSAPKSTDGPKDGILRVNFTAPDEIDHSWDDMTAERRAKLLSYDARHLMCAYMKMNNAPLSLFNVFNSCQGLHWGEALAACAMITALGNVMSRKEKVYALDPNDKEAHEIAGSFSTGDIILALKAQVGTGIMHMSSIMFQEELLKESTMVPTEFVYEYGYFALKYQVFGKETLSREMCLPAKDQVEVLAGAMHKRVVVHNVDIDLVDIVGTSASLSGDGPLLVVNKVSYPSPPVGTPLIMANSKNGGYYNETVVAQRTAVADHMRMAWGHVIKHANPARPSEPKEQQLKMPWFINVACESPKAKAMLERLRTSYRARGLEVTGSAKFKMYADALSLLSGGPALPLAQVKVADKKAVERVRLFFANNTNGYHPTSQGHYPAPYDAIRYLEEHRKFRNDEGTKGWRSDMFQDLTDAVPLCPSLGPAVHTMAKMAPAVSWLRAEMKARSIDAVDVYGVGHKGHFIPLFHGMGPTFFDVQTYPGNVKGYTVTQRDVLASPLYYKEMSGVVIFSDVFLESVQTAQSTKKDTVTYQRYVTQEKVLKAVVDANPVLAVVKGFLPNMHYTELSGQAEPSRLLWMDILSRYEVTMTPGGSYHSGETYYCLKVRPTPVVVDANKWYLFAISLARASVALCLANDLRSGLVAACALPPAGAADGTWFRKTFGTHLPPHIVPLNVALSEMIENWKAHNVAERLGIKGMPHISVETTNFLDFDGEDWGMDGDVDVLTSHVAAMSIQGASDATPPATPAPGSSGKGAQG